MPAAHPPKPAFAFAVGVIGHRPDRLPEGAEARVRPRIGSALAAIRAAGAAAHARHKNCFAHEAEQFLLVSALAEGTDRIGAAQALDKGFALAVPLPFPPAEYEKDFHTETSKAEFRRLLAAATSVLQFGGDRAMEGKSYEQAGLALLDASDILIAVWDAKPSAGRGGTTEMVYEAARRGMPILRIDPAEGGGTHLHWREGLTHPGGAAYFDRDFSTEALDGLAIVVDRLLRPPRAASETAAMRGYLRQPFRRWTLSMEFPLLTALMGLRRLRLGDMLRTPPRIVAQDMAARELAPRPLIDAYAWADEIAVIFGQTFRGAFIANFLLSALVTISVVALDPPASVVEFVLVVLLILNTSIGRRRRWHHLWIESREVAERLRVAMPVHGVGSRNPMPFGDAATWTTWYVRAQLRQAGLRNAVLDGAAIVSVRQSLRGLLEEQKSYHHTTAQRFRALHRRLTAVGLTFFVAASVICVISIYLEYFAHYPDAAHRWLVAMSAGFPAIAAASYGIRVIGEFDGAAARSERMHAQLTVLIDGLKHANDPESLREVCHRAAEVMLGDVASWRLVVESRELEMPG
jgi:hypothetical protein